MSFYRLCSSFYGSAVLPLIVRDAVKQCNYPKRLKKDIGQAHLYYEEMGTGEPVIFIHGHSLSHSMWDEQFFEFAKKYRTIRYDLRGYGYSSPQKEDEQFLHAKDIKVLMDSLKINKAHIIGLSLGEFVATDMITLYPDRLLSATLDSGNIFPILGTDNPMSDKEREKRQAEINTLKRKSINVMKREWLESLMKSGGTERERMRKPLWNMVYQWDAWQPLHLEPRHLLDISVRDKLKNNNLNIPVLIIEGRSENNRYSNNPKILNYLLNVKLIVIENAGHMLNMKQPRAFNDSIFIYLKRLL